MYSRDRIRARLLINCPFDQSAGGRCLARPFLGSTIFTPVAVHIMIQLETVGEL